MSTRPSAVDPNLDRIGAELGLTTASGQEQAFRDCVLALREELLSRAHADRYEATLRDLAVAVGYPVLVVRAALEAMQHDAPRHLFRVDDTGEVERWRFDPPELE